MLPTEDLLRSILHGIRLRGNNESPERQEWTAAGGEDRERFLRCLWALGNEAFGAPCRRESDQQRPVEFSDLVRVVSREDAFGEFRGVSPAKEVLQVMRAAGPAAWPMLEASFRPEAWVISSSFPLAHGAPGRVGRLRAYGNGIVAPLAAEFIASFVEALLDPDAEVSGG